MRTYANRGAGDTVAEIVQIMCTVLIARRLQGFGMAFIKSCNQFEAFPIRINALELDPRLWDKKFITV